MPYPIVKISYETVDGTDAIAIVAATSHERARSLLEQDLRECQNFHDPKISPIKETRISYFDLPRTRNEAIKEGVIYNSQSEDCSDCAEEGWGHQR